MRLRWVPLSLVLLTSCAPDGANPAIAAIGDGTASTNASVVHVTAGDVTCSGAIVGPRHVLTAKLCAWNGTTAARAPADLTVREGATIGSGGGIGVTEIVMTPGAPAMGGATNELAILVTAEDLDGGALGIAAAAPAPDTTITAIGYGEDEAGAGGTRREGAMTVELVQPGVITAIGPAGVCDGDVGGPALDATGAIAGIATFSFSLSGGDPACPDGSGFANAATYRGFVLDAVGGGDPDAGAGDPDAGGTDAGAPPVDDGGAAGSDASPPPALDAGSGGGGGGCATAPGGSGPWLLAAAVALALLRRR